MSSQRRTSRLAAIAMAAAFCVSVPLVLGFLKHLHPAFDSFAHLRAHLAVLLAVLSLPLLFFASWRAHGLLALALAVAAFTSVLDVPLLQRLSGGPAEASPPDVARYRLLQLNLRYDNSSPKEVLSLIGRSQPDVITLEEVSAMWRRELALIEKAYPHSLFCSRPGVGGVAILSRRPFLHPSRAECFNKGALAIATVSFGGTAVDIAAIHLGWPWPFEQSRQLTHVTPTLKRKMGATAILAGDLNAVSWSAAAEQLAAAGGLTRLRHIGPTWLAQPLPNRLRRVAGLPIDNIFVKGRIAVVATRRLDDAGSDHLPVLLEFDVLPQLKGSQTLQASVAALQAVR
ncbi:endonuclease/exonuclease/phosphatase family protein [Chelativorans sp. AA-79]|uniref:endonuclease/exonuclease/phosphatase family protein n=1 Tax=Chelativorans sp. AA-79 TaxID=3028735 RepID=UPI0023F70A05|nr:endonuclease/exonuclease/phosphatase family protein [Chelativorans sp. AA-79]WEX07706.1 endonuclease/exonuclease/phosphatase family protein [Chelativorans sp. AA-79]